MITINGVNKWTPAIYSKQPPVNWTAERNRAINWRNIRLHSKSTMLLKGK